MIVDCRDLPEFLAEVARVSDRVFEKLVRVRIDRFPEQDEELTFTVDLWATALIVSHDGSGNGYLVEFSGHCGTDDAGGPQAGTIEAARLSQLVADLCQANGLVLAGGKWEI